MNPQIAQMQQFRFMFSPFEHIYIPMREKAGSSQSRSKNKQKLLTSEAKYPRFDPSHEFMNTIRADTAIGKYRVQAPESILAQLIPGQFQIDTRCPANAGVEGSGGGTGWPEVEVEVAQRRGTGQWTVVSLEEGEGEVGVGEGRE